MTSSIRWAYGVTTVPSRKSDLLPRTLASLAKAGFNEPHLFVDGAKDGFNDLGLNVTYRYPNVRTAGNWVLSLYELYYRNPSFERFALFQDDFVTVRNLREYLTRLPYPEKGYCNLYTFPNVEIPIVRKWYSQKHPNECKEGFRQMPFDYKDEFRGWFPTQQNGRGAVALVFNREAVTTLLLQQHLVERPQDVQRGHRAIDGGIVDSMNKAGWREFCHSPSLTQHTGLHSSMGNRPHKLAVSFPGEEFDALTLLS